MISFFLITSSENEELTPSTEALMIVFPGDIALIKPF
jgi:hypothetical protein